MKKPINPGDPVRLNEHARRLYNLPEGMIYRVKTPGKYVHIWELPHLVFMSGEVEPVKPVHKTPEALIWAIVGVICTAMLAGVAWMIRNGYLN